VCVCVCARARAHVFAADFNLAEFDMNACRTNVVSGVISNVL
jgi:hypothetical protein